MSNWTSITVDNLKAAGYGDIVDGARTEATGGVDPVVQEIADAVARVRRAVATGNSLDANESKVPNSLLGVTVRLALYGLMRRIRFALSEDQRNKERDDISDLKRIADNKLRVELPDDNGGSGEMQRGNVVAAVNVPRRETGRGRQSGL